MNRFPRAILVAFLSVIAASILLGIAATIWHHNGISERTLPASVDAFLFLFAFSAPPTLFVGLPLAAKISTRLLPVAGVVAGTVYGMFLTWMDDFFTGPGIDLKWSLLGTLQGVLIGIFALLFLRAIPQRRIGSPVQGQ